MDTMDQILRKFQNLPTTVRMSVPKGSTAVSYFLKLREIMISSRELFEQLTDKTVATQKVDPITFVTALNQLQVIYEPNGKNAGFSLLCVVVARLDSMNLIQQKILITALNRILDLITTAISNAQLAPQQLAPSFNRNSTTSTSFNSNTRIAPTLQKKT